MSTTALLAVATTFIAVMLLTKLLVGILWNPNTAIKTRLQQIQARDEIYNADEPLAQPLLIRIFGPVLAKLDQTISRFTPATLLQHIDADLERAGRPWNLSAAQYVVGRLIVGVVVPLLLLGVMGDKANFIMVIGLFGLGNVIPRFLLKKAVTGRRKSIDRELPNALDLLTVSVEAGLGFDGAILKMVEKTTGPLTQEFRRMLQEIRIGKARREALRELAERCGTEDVQTFVAAVIQADQLGVSIGRVLRIQSQQMRMKRRQQAEERAMKAPIKMLIPMILFIFPTIFIVLLGPGVLEMLDQAKNIGLQ